MIVKTIENGFQVHKSDSNKYIRKVGTGEIYAEAIDILDKEVEYEETDEEMEPIPAEYQNNEE